MTAGPRTPVAAVILAAGAGSRFGGPKAMARQGGRTWLAIAIETLATAGLPWASIVIGAEAGRVRATTTEVEIDGRRWSLEGPRPACGAMRVSWVLNPDWAAGRTGSLQRGLNDLPAEAGAALVHAVDFPRIHPETVRRLVSAWYDAPRRGSLLCVPVASGRRGHPIAIGRDVWPEIAALGRDEPLRTVVRRDRGRVLEVAVADEGIHANLNRPPEEEAK